MPGSFSSSPKSRPVPASSPLTGFGGASLAEFLHIRTRGVALRPRRPPARLEVLMAQARLFMEKNPLERKMQATTLAR
jgi:hypothetical protein